jgi:hypothetical protein
MNIAARLAICFAIFFGPSLCLGQTLLQQKAEPAPLAKYEDVSPSRDNPTHFVARAKHLVDMVRATPPMEEYKPVAGIDLLPRNIISKGALKLLADERGEFDPGRRDELLRCNIPTNLPEDVQVIALEAASDFSVPVFLTEHGELHYLELSLDQPGPPVLLIVDGYMGLALRVNASPSTKVAAIHLMTYDPNVVLGVEPRRVTQQYFSRSADAKCAYSGRIGSRADSLVKSLGLSSKEIRRYKTVKNSEAAIGSIQPNSRNRPTLGEFLDPEVPLPDQYGLVVLAHLGYVRAMPLLPQGGEAHSYMRRDNALEVLRPFRIPRGLSGAHSVTFFLNPTSPVPSGELGHSIIVRRVQ